MAADVRAGAVVAGLLLVPALAGTALAQGANAPAPSAPATGTAPVPRHHRVSASGPIATLPGFEMLADGASRLFVELTQTVAVDEKKNGRRVIYTLEGTHVIHRNNENALVTVHFNTPVQRARLLPSGKNLLFVVDLRAEATPTWKITPAKDNTAILEIVFPKGDYLPATQDAEPDPDGTASSGANPRAAAPDPQTPEPPPPGRHGRRRVGGAGGPGGS